VTLGTPHRIAPSVDWRHPGVRAAELLERSTPGDWHAPNTGYLTVGSTFVAPRQRMPVHPLRQGIGGLMRLLVGTTPGARSDGIVDDVLTRLGGAHHLALPDVLHGTIGGPWYGDAHIIDRWWPEAVERWRRALQARDIDEEPPVTDAPRPNNGRAPLRSSAGSSPGALSGRPR
jgi:hypothetical protein